MKEIETIQIIQDYIRIHHKDDDFNANDVCSKIGYSRRQVLAEAPKTPFMNDED